MNVERAYERAKSQYGDVLIWLAHYENPKDDCACLGCDEARADEEGV